MFTVKVKCPPIVEVVIHSRYPNDVIEMLALILEALRKRRYQPEWEIVN
jgi:hypothetical protein